MSRKTRVKRKEETCLRKRKYATYKEAKNVRKLLIAKRGDAARGVQVYICDICNHYHLGNPSKSQLQMQKMLKKQREEITVLIIEEALAQGLPVPLLALG
jgi:hypothetical protein